MWPPMTALQTPPATADGASGARVLTVSDPATGEAIGTIPAGSAEAADAAVAAARAAQPAWARTSRSSSRASTAASS